MAGDSPEALLRGHAKQRRVSLRNPIRILEDFLVVILGRFRVYLLGLLLFKTMTACIPLSRTSSATSNDAKAAMRQPNEAIGDVVSVRCLATSGVGSGHLPSELRHAAVVGLTRQESIFRLLSGSDVWLASRY